MVKTWESGLQDRKACQPLPNNCSIWILSSCFPRCVVANLLGRRPLQEQDEICRSGVVALQPSAACTLSEPSVDGRWLVPEINDRPFRVLDPAGSKAAEQPRWRPIQQERVLRNVDGNRYSFFCSWGFENCMRWNIEWVNSFVVPLIRGRKDTGDPKLHR